MKALTLTSITLLSTLVVAALISGCPGSMCTEMGCGELFQLTISCECGSALEQGSYQVEIETADGETTLTCNTADEAGCHTFSEEWYGYLDGDAIHIEYYGYDGNTPDAIDVSVTFDDQALGIQHFELDWTVYYPNGEDCDPGCWTADNEEMLIEHPVLLE